MQGTTNCGPHGFREDLLSYPIIGLWPYGSFMLQLQLEFQSIQHQNHMQPFP